MSKICAIIWNITYEVHATILAVRVMARTHFYASTVWWSLASKMENRLVRGSPAQYHVHCRCLTTMMSGCHPNYTRCPTVMQHCTTRTYECLLPVFLINDFQRRFVWWNRKSHREQLLKRAASQNKYQLPACEKLCNRSAHNQKSTTSHRQHMFLKRQV